VIYVLTTNLVHHNTKSCGCRRHRVSREIHTTHGATGTPTYKIWRDMKTRCQNKNSSGYPKYGAKGVTVCQRWQTFENFLADMGEQPQPGYTIERRENGKGYTPDNCLWIPKAEQARNKTTNHRITANGETKTLADWARALNTDHTTLLGRLARGWPEEEAVTRPVHHIRR
jgi:hypothetical protein